MTDRPARPPRAEPREIVELRQLKATQPELASAVDMQIALVELQRRVQARVPLPWLQAEPDWMLRQQRAGRPVVRFGDIPLDWTDFRLAMRQTADVLRRYDTLEPADHGVALSLARDGNRLQPFMAAWYNRTSGVEEDSGPSAAATEHPSIDHVLVLAIRPFLARCAEALARNDFSEWKQGHCPYCGWEPDFAVITPGAERRLICGRCLGQWTFEAWTCPFCSNDDRALVTSFATRDGQYRVYACDVCRRYLKAYDARNRARPLLVAVDTIATLPLDAAAIQKGYLG